MMYLNWGISLFSMITSLIFSEILNLPPCSLCWYQRIFMYSMVFIIPTGIILKDSKLNYYSAVLSFIGGLIAIYHNLIYFEILKTGLKVCTSDLSCKSKQLSLFGFLSIPTMSLIAFVIILTISLRGLKNEIK